MPAEPALLLLCGPAFSGKSTLARALRERHGFMAVSLDAINARRGLHGGDGVADEEWTRTLEAALEETGRLLSMPGARVLVDDTLCYRFLRDAFRARAARSGRAARLIVMATEPEEIRRRAAHPDGRRGIRPAVLERHLAAFEWPGADEPHRRARGPADVDAWAQEGWLG